MKYYYNPNGPDVNGNGGPSFGTDDWIVIEADSYYKAVLQLSVDEWAKVMRFVGTGATTAKPDPVGDLIADTAGWGLPFTLCSEEEFMMLKEGE